MEKILNAVGWRCPKPIIETKKCLDEMEKGTVTTIVDNAEAVENLIIFSGNSGYEISQRQENDLFYVTIEKTGQSESLKSKNDLVILITSNTFGEGAKDLGENLMQSYIYALTEVEPKPKP